MPVAVTVLYEDSLGLNKEFGLHALVKASVFDAIDGERHRVEDMLEDARPMKGVARIAAASVALTSSSARFRSGCM